MSLHIELLSLGCELHEQLEAASALLNSVQDEFRFALPPPRLKYWGKDPSSKSEILNTSEIFELLRRYRIEAKGRRPYLIAFVNKPLYSSKLSNLFGSSKSTAGLAVVTVDNAERFAPSMRSYLAYYLTRYSLGFVAPDMKNHEDTRDCFFDRKISKYDLRRSLASGELCVDCRTVFEKVSNDEIDVAFAAMAREVARLSFAASAAAIEIRSARSPRVTEGQREPSEIQRPKIQSEETVTGTKRRLFYSYSQADENSRERLDTHLRVLERTGLIETWHSRRLLPGADWAEETSKHLEQANIILLLTSADFLASDYVWDVEMKRALKLHEERRSIVIPIILRPCMWREAPFAKLQPLPVNAVPVTRWSDPEDAWLDVVQGIQKILKPSSGQ